MKLTTEYRCHNCGKMFEAAAYYPADAKPRCPDEEQHDNRVSTEALLEKIKKSMGRFFTIVFTKRSTGEKRTMTCRLGVKKHLKGGARAYDPESMNLMIVWEPRSAMYKSIPTDAIVEAKIAGKVYQVVK
jgi:hypothetical protein